MDLRGSSASCTGNYMHRETGSRHTAMRSLHLSEGAAADERERLEVRSAHALALEARELALARLQLVDHLAPLRLRQLPLLQLLLQLPSPADPVMRHVPMSR